MPSPLHSSTISLDADTEPGWGGLLRELATEPDSVVVPVRAVAPTELDPSATLLQAPVAPPRAVLTAPSRATGFGGLQDTLLVFAAFTTAVVVVAAYVAAMYYA